MDYDRLKQQLISDGMNRILSTDLKRIHRDEIMVACGVA